MRPCAAAPAADGGKAGSGGAGDAAAAAAAAAAPAPAAAKTGAPSPPPTPAPYTATPFTSGRVAGASRDEGGGNGGGGNGGVSAPYVDLLEVATLRDKLTPRPSPFTRDNNAGAGFGEEAASGGVRDRC